ASGTDFNGDGIDDLLWRNTAGDLSNWLGTSTGALSANDANAFNTVSLDWKVVGTGDFNGDGRADILWRNTNGDLTTWLGNANGGYIDNSSVSYYAVPTSYKVVGVGDFNGDGFSDILWRSSTGTITDWLGTANGSFQVNDANSTTSAPLDWNVAGTGDFNGDGRSDIVWRRVNGELSDWLGQPNGGFVSNGSVAGAVVETRWTITGVGDFNGDGRSDLLWRSTSGELVDWLGRPDGGFSDNTPNAYYQVGTEWQVVGNGDYNGDGRADILWRKTSGDLTSDQSPQFKALSGYKYG
ncbi:VCBS repeat-containing protein, partial [Sphingomonas sp. 28-63-12]|uniref:FG-GAP repeat domain-containing protein n=1 Tax=Sphingomonas sp. 28-63-12 TaxID=1970434 RepID=UPI000BC4BE24